jgi:hypothetical protein
VNARDIKDTLHSQISAPNSKASLYSPVMSFYVPSTPTRHRSRSFAQPLPIAGSSYPYPNTPYSGYNTLAPYYDSPGHNSSQTYYVAPSISGRSRSRSRSRHGHAPSHSRSHGHSSNRRSHSHHRQHHGRQPSHQRRSQSTTSHRHQRPSNHVRFSMSKTERLAQFFSKL